MNKKKKTPIRVLKALEPFVNKVGEKFVRVDSENFIISFNDIDSDSDFHFNIEQYDSKNEFKLLVGYKPFSENSVDNKRVWIKGSELDKTFNSWIQFLNIYDNIKSPFDDPITESYYQEYFTDFEIIDEEKESPLERKNIIPLYEHFEEIKLRLNEYKDDNNKEQIEEIQTEIDELNNNLTSKGRQWVATKISTIWARLTKMGVKYFKEFVEVSRKKLFKVGAEKIFELAEEGMKFIQDIDKLAQ